MCHIIYFLKSCWNQAITLKDILENIPKPLGEKPEWLALREATMVYLRTTAVLLNQHASLGLSCENTPAFCTLYIWLHFKGQRLSELLFSSLDCMVRIVSQWSRSKILFPPGWPINLGILRSAFYWAITCSAGLWNFDWIFSCHRVMLKKGNLEKEAQGYVLDWNAFLRK